MLKRLSTENLARASARHRWTAIGAWLVVLAAAIVLSGTLLGGALSSEVTTLTNNPESVQADQLLRERLGESNDGKGETAIVRSTSLTVDDPAYRAHVEQLYSDLNALGEGVIAGGTHYYLAGDESLVSADRHTTLVPLMMAEDGWKSIDEVHRVIEQAREDNDFEVLVAGAATLDAEIAEVAEKDLARGEGIGISVALVVLALVFGAIAASLLPIVVAVTAIVVAMGAAALVGQGFELPYLVINIMTMMGLAVGIDYSLFVVSRYREERAKGVEKIEAIAATGATAGRTVLFSGATVALALGGLLITPDSANQAVGIGVLLVVAAAVSASVTLLPALLGLLGDRVNSMRIPFVQRPVFGRTSPDEDRGFWTWTARAVMRRPLVSLVIAAGVLLAAAGSCFDMNQGEVGVSTLPDGLMSKDAFVVLQDEFGFGQDMPAVVVIDGPTSSESVQAGIRRLEAVVVSDPAFATSEVEVHEHANLSILRARLSGDPAGAGAMAAIGRLRSEYVPDAFAGVPASVMVTGRTAWYVDAADNNATYTPIVIGFVLSLSFVVLMVAFRSIVIPAKAIALNLLSVGASYGLLVLVFQKGVGARSLGFQQVDVIQTGLPLALFAILFGLSMDYHVFLLSRVRERFLQCGDNTEAVAFGLRSTGRLITGAALIMVAVFGGFALGDLAAMQQFGFGMAVAVLLDATIVRSVLVPSTMKLLGAWNWYLPKWMSWLPDLRVERDSDARISGRSVSQATPGD